MAPPPCPDGMQVAPPDFVGVGVQKAGTSWWFAQIRKHPDVFSGIHKELHYFSRFWRDPFSQADADEYHRWFPRPPAKRCGEWTPIYMSQFWTPPLLERAAPDARLLVLLRDPVERYRSGITHWITRGEIADPRVASDAFLRGLYDAQLGGLLRCFDNDRVLVLQYERCRQDTSAELTRTYRFLGLDPSFVPDSVSDEVNKTPGEKVALPNDAREHLVDRYEPSVRQLLSLVPDLDLALWPNFRHLA